MYEYIWDDQTGGILLTTNQSKFSKEPRPVYSRELDILGFDQYWNYPHDDSAPIMWAEATNYYYRGKLVAKTKGGSLYTKPEIIIIENNPEPAGELLRLVDIKAMCDKNRNILETLVQETIQKIYNTFMEYRKKIDIYYVAFSGGKDSVVTLDLVQRALPHDAFKVIFSDTGMEFSDTYDLINEIKSYCSNETIDFLISKSHFDPTESWRLFGPPCSVTRWCCSVHKTAPQILLLRQVLNKPDFTGMAFVEVRADESLARSKYDYVTYGGKHRGQYSCNAILEWSSAEIFLYIYDNNLPFNETYKKGNRRAGCLICPRAAERNDYMNHFCYSEQADVLVNSIKSAYSKAFAKKEQLTQFIEAGGWKARKNGRDIDIPLNYKEVRNKDNSLIIQIESPRTNWKQWIKTIGILANEQSPFTIKYHEAIISFDVDESDNTVKVFVSAKVCKENAEFVKLLKNVFRKAACCVGCKECQADCPYGNLTFENGEVIISDACKHCAQCHKVEKGCLVYKSLEQVKGGSKVAGKNTSLNSYSHFAPKADWIKQYFTYKNDFDDNHDLGTQMYSFFKRFLRDAELLDNTGFSKTAEVCENVGYESETAWGIIFTNLCYTPQTNWYVRTVGFDSEYSKALLTTLMVESGAKDSWTNDIFSAISRISELPIGKIGYGVAVKDKKKATGIIRSKWENPVPEVILYSLFKFAEACDGYYQFSLSTLMDDSLEREGISPSRMFGLDRDTMIGLLNNLSTHYPEFIRASFTLDLETITLSEDKSAEDVLNLF
ncbi:MAG: phosphoadenosine phosphosulfate reductase family protein [Ruminococcus sp.]|nr:phosphoadenosine phosphosulfate reductase family protein [Ruminococcus sp.]